MKNGFIAAGEKLLSRAAHALEHHPRQVTAALAALMLCAGGGAYAVASDEPEVQPVVREVLESVATLPVSDQLKTLDLHAFNLYRSETTRATDTAESLLARAGVADAQALSFLRSHDAFRTRVLGASGRNVTIEVNDSHELQKLTARWATGEDTTFKRLTIEKSAAGQFVSRIEMAPMVPAARMASATVRTSLFAAADEAAIPDSIIAQLVEIFGSDIDFHRSLKSGDRLNVVYEALEADGEPLRTGRILSAEFVNKGKSHQAMWFQEAGRKGSYYTLDGKSLETSFLASPMEFSRVTSGFAMRMHPIHNTWKAHLGVDYGAATGTPVRTVGDGVVEFAGQQNGFGNVIIVKHNASAQTLYAHLSRIDVRLGQKVNIGDRIGAVGATGWATGPHLHFEFRVDGAQQDPIQMARHSASVPLSAAARPEFERLARSMGAQLAAAGSTTAVARAN
ncbi:MAG: M23 family metallopeptidase [Ramlibacter sp.]|nr:M23 family metallopeptidase [Ramlibacter sp.]